MSCRVRACEVGKSLSFVITIVSCRVRACDLSANSPESVGAIASGEFAESKTP